MISFDTAHCAAYASSSPASGTPSTIISESSTPSNPGPVPGRSRNTTSNQSCSAQRRWDTTPATVISGEAGSRERCASASDSPAHFRWMIARCRSYQPISWVRSSATSGGRSRGGVMTLAWSRWR